MKKPSLKKKLIVLALGALASGAASLHAGVIVVSGDANITNGLVGVQTPQEAGNQRFFRNVLGTGTTVLVGNGSPDFFSGLFGAHINNFYNSVSGVSSSFLGSAPISEAALDGVDLFAAVLPANPYSATELTALNAFLGSGKSLFLLGDNGNAAFVNRNANINAALSTLGSSLSINNAFLDTGAPLFDAATGSQIATNPLTEGVTRLTYSVASEVQTVTGGTGLFSSSNGTTFIATETVNASVPDGGTSALLLGLGLLTLGAVKSRFSSGAK